MKRLIIVLIIAAIVGYAIPTLIRVYETIRLEVAE